MIFMALGVADAIFVFNRSQRRGEGARGGENGHIKVRKQCAHTHIDPAVQEVVKWEC